MTLFDRFFNWFVFVPIVTLMAIALLPLVLFMMCYDAVATCNMTADEKRRHYATWEPY
jgi:hypothetical protein